MSLRQAIRRLDRTALQIIMAGGLGRRLLPHSVFDPSIQLAKGVQIMAGVTIQADTIIGVGTIINTRANVDHYLSIGP